MKQLLLMRGSAGVGKSSYLEINGLDAYSINVDKIRLLFAPPILGESNEECVSSANDKEVWELLFKFLERRMEQGYFTIIDATHTTTKSIEQYKPLADKYGYETYVLDFTDVPIEITKQRNIGRQQYKRVPNHVIDKMYARFETEQVPSWVTVIKPNELSIF